jgi:Tol biopolymer transport system component
LTALFLSLAALLGLFVASASATITRQPEPFSPIDGSGIGATLNQLSGIAIDEATGNVFFTNERNDGVLVAGAEGGTPAGVASPFKVPGTEFFRENTAAFLAYDNSSTSPAKGTLYAYDNAGKIRKYRRNAASETYEEVSGDEIAVPGCGFGAGGGMDDEGNVYFGCPELSKIYVFGPAGAKLHEYDLSATPVTFPGQIAVDAAGDLFVQQQAGGLYKFPVNGSGEIEPSNYTQVVPSTQDVSGVAYEPEANEIVVAESGRAEEFNATTLTKIGEFGREIFPSRTQRVALDLKTHRAYVVDYANEVVEVFGPDVTVATVKAAAATNITGTKATLNGSVDPEGLEVTECFFEWGTTTQYGHIAPCEELPPTDSESHLVSANISGLVSNGATYHYRLVAKNENGPEKSNDKTLLSANTVITKAATGVGTGTATLNGTVLPEGLAFSECFFEYKLATGASYQQVPCDPGAGEIEPDFTTHPVSAALAKLQPNSTYEFRLTATNSEATHSGKVLTFTTSGPPQITEIRALNATQNAATIEGKIDPSGFGTSYRFEWGPTTSYGNRVPAEFEPYVGDGRQPVRVSAQLPGLSAGQTYHYRIVATSLAGSSASPDQSLETVNSCGLPEERCFELVSRREAGPTGIVGQALLYIELHFQAATEGGGLAYLVEGGYPDSTKGAEVLYRGTRGPAGWSSTQLSTPIVALNEQGGGESGTGPVVWLSHDLSCGFAESYQPLTSDPATRLVREYGSSNLYRINPDGSYTAVSNLTPENAEQTDSAEKYKVAFASQDCSKVLFRTNYRYPGVPGVGVPRGPYQSRLYEWDEGTLRNAGVVPGPSGEVAVGATAGVEDLTFENSQNTVSEDGSRIFFTAERQTSSNPEEIGKEAIFVREDGTTSRDLSLSETSVPDKGAHWQWAAPDGSHVFFTANAGLTDESSSEGPDLYMYDLESEKLTDITAYDGEGGAQVAGFVGATEDGSHVYFVSPNQLVPGRGKTLAENQSAKTLSLYGESNGEFDFVGTVGEGFTELGYIALRSQREWTSRVSPNGRYLLFQAATNVTDYDSGGAREVYLYDAAGGSEGTVCVSCRQDGQPSVGPNNYEPLRTEGTINNYLNGPQFLTMHDGEPQVFFQSPDKLAPGAIESQNNVYEWSHGQVFRLTSAQKGQQVPSAAAGQYAFFAGASRDGSDAYFVTPETINWEDGDERLSAYDARVGGGFPEPAAPSVPCEAASEGSGSCQGPAQGAPALSGAASAAFNGPGNPPQQSTKKKSKKPHKKKHKHAKKKGKSKQARQANGNRRAGK